MGGHRRHPQGDRRGARGDLDDHAQLDGDLGRLVAAGPGGPLQGAAEVDPRFEQRRRRRSSCRSSGARRCSRGSRSGSSSRSRCSSSMADHQPLDARLRDPRRRVQPRSRAVRGHLGRPQLLSGDGDRRCVRRARRRARHPRLASTSSVSWTCARARSGSWGSPPRCSGETPRSASVRRSLLFGALLTGTSGRQLDPTIFRPDLAGNLTTIIQGLVVLFVGLNLAALPLWCEKRAPEEEDGVVARAARGSDWLGPRASASTGSFSARWASGSRCRRSQSRSTGGAGRARDPRDRGRASGRARAASGGSVGRDRGGRPRASRSALLATQLVGDSPRQGRRLERALRGDAPLRDAALLRRDRRPLLRAQRRRQHRARGDAAERRLLRPLGGDLGTQLGGQRGVARRHRGRGARPAWCSPRSMPSGRSTFKVDQIISGTAINFLALGITGYLFIDKYGDSGTPGQHHRLRHPGHPSRLHLRHPVHRRRSSASST